MRLRFMSLIIVLGVLLFPVLAGADEGSGYSNMKKNALEFGPLIDIYFLRYGRMISLQDEVTLGLVYHNTAIGNMIPYPGNLWTVDWELGYRRYLWRGLYLEASVLPQWVVCNDTTAGIIYQGFDTALEGRLGYRFTFNLAGIIWLVNLQFFAGYRILDPRPLSFVSAGGGRFYPEIPIPMLLLGVQF